MNTAEKYEVGPICTVCTMDMKDVSTQSMAKQPAKTRSKQINLYDESSKKHPPQYEVVRLPLQDQVSTVRKAFSRGWSQFREAVRSSISSLRMNAQEKLLSLGVKQPRTVLQASAVGTAAMVGLFMARNRSTFHRVLYPLVGGGTAWGAIQFSDKKTREEVSSVIKKEFSENFSREFSKHFPNKSTSGSTKANQQADSTSKN